MSFRFVDEHQKTARPIWQFVASPSGLKALENVNETFFDQPRPEVIQALDVVRSLPLLPKSQVSFSPYLKDPEAYAIIGAEPFEVNSKVPSPDIVTAHIQKSWARLDEVKKAIQLLQNFALETNTRVGLGVLQVKRSFMLRNKVNRGLVAPQEMTAVDTFAQTKCLALYGSVKYIRDGRVVEGYVSTQNTLRPLAYARFFESEKAIAVFLKKHKILTQFNALQIVDIGIHMEGVGKVLVADTPNNYSQTNLAESRLQEAVAHVQKETMHKALEAASREALVQRLEALEGHDTIEAPSAPKRRM